MEREKIKRLAIEIGRDLLLAFVVVLVIMLALYGYCRIWPPMVVVESGSMQHGDRSYIGVIDTGDMVFVKKVNGRDDVITYVDGEANHYSTYGAFGDVVVYMPNGDANRVPIIHRLVLWIEANASAVSTLSYGIDYDNYTFDVPSFEMSGSLEDVVLHDYGYEHDNVTISLNGLILGFKNRGIAPHNGFITMGDHNSPNHDQSMSGYEPILPEWIIGKAIGELPWFGLIKLSVTNDISPSVVPRNSWVNLFASIVLLISAPLIVDFVFPIIKKRVRASRADKTAGEGDALGENGEPDDKTHPDVEESQSRDGGDVDKVPTERGPGKGDAQRPDDGLT